MPCKIMAGQDVMGTSKVNASWLHHNNRRKNKEKPSGRKQPRKKDFDARGNTKKGIHNKVNCYDLIFYSS